MASKWTTGGALRKEINALDPVADDQLVTRLTSDVLYADPYFAHSIFLVTFARQASVPGIARVLYRSGNGDVIREPRRRNNDTIIFFTEFFRRGYKTPAGIEAIARMEQIHSNFLMTDDLKLYTLATVMFEPDRLAAQFGCYPFSEVEIQGRWNFWKGFAAQIPLELPADTRDGFLQWMENYEKETYAYTPDGAAIFDALVEDWKRWYPAWLPRRETLVRESLIALLDDHTRETLGLEPPSKLMSLRVKLTAQAYLKGTPIRPLRRGRSVVNYFGKQHVDPHDLENVGFKPKRFSRDKTLT